MALVALVALVARGSGEVGKWGSGEVGKWNIQRRSQERIRRVVSQQFRDTKRSETEVEARTLIDWISNHDLGRFAFFIALAIHDSISVFSPVVTISEKNAALCSELGSRECWSIMT